MSSWSRIEGMLTSCSRFPDYLTSLSGTEDALASLQRKVSSASVMKLAEADNSTL